MLFVTTYWNWNQNYIILLSFLTKKRICNFLGHSPLQKTKLNFFVTRFFISNLDNID